MKQIYKAILIAITLTLSGCAPSAPTANSKYDKPDWINNHSEGVVGICDSHMKGDAVQEQVAMDRALEKLSKQKGVEVESDSVSTQKETSAYYSSGHKSTSKIKSNNKVKGTIKDTWRDPKTNRYYIWMVMD